MPPPDLFKGEKTSHEAKNTLAAQSCQGTFTHIRSESLSRNSFLF